MHTNGAKALTLNSGRKTQVDLLLCADFNRHHGLWGGAQVFGEAGRNNEAEAIIDLMQENALTSLLPSGTVTWDHYNGSTCSTINIVLVSSDLSETCEYCDIYHNDRDSDHKAVRAHLALDTREHQGKRRRRMYDKADRKKVREEVSKRIADDFSLHALSTNDGLEVAVDRLKTVVNWVLQEHVARVRLSAYAKPWWNDKLTTLRLQLSAARNHLTAVRRGGDDIVEAAARVKLIRRLTYMDSCLWLRELCATWPCDHIGDCGLWYGTAHTRGRPKEFRKSSSNASRWLMLSGRSLALCSGSGAVEDEDWTICKT
jgi:hypothetical protein